MGIPLQKEPAKILLEERYVKWFTGKYTMNNINTQILKDRYLSMFGETLVNTNPAPNYGRFSSSDNDMKGYVEEMIVGVAAGDEFEYWWSSEERRKTDAVMKEALIVCVKNLMPPYSWSTYLFDVTAIPYAIVKYGTSIAAKTLGAKIVLSCGKAIVDNWQSNSKECGDIICDYTSSESGSGDRYGNEKSSSDKLVLVVC